jgi:acyl carrier protein
MSDFPSHAVWTSDTILSYHRTVLVGNYDIQGGVMDQQAIEDMIIELLAEEAGTVPAALRLRLEEAGDELPVDSLLAAEVVVRVEERCGVQLPATAETARCLRSVRDFAAMVCHLVTEVARSRAAGAGA